MATAPNLDQLKQTLADKQAAFDKAAAELDQATVDHNQAKVAAMDPKVVQDARDWGLNPDNFEDTTHLQAAVDAASKTREQVAQPEVAAGLNQDLVTEAKQLGIDTVDVTSDDQLQNLIYKAQKANQPTPGMINEADAAPAE